MGEVKEDCILYDSKWKSCRGLDKLYCERESRSCAFYKSDKEYHLDGRPKDFWERFVD